MNVRYRVELSQAERDELTTLLSKGKRAARKLKRAQIYSATIWMKRPSIWMKRGGRVGR